MVWDLPPKKNNCMPDVFEKGLCCIILHYWLIEYLIICTSLIHSLSASPLSYSGFLPVFCYLCRKRQEIEANVHISNIKIKRCFHNHAKCSSLEKWGSSSWRPKPRSLVVTDYCSFVHVKRIWVHLLSLLAWIIGESWQILGQNSEIDMTLAHWQK